MTLHARLSPSSAQRWINCPGSIREIEKAPPAPDSFAAREGTAAHELAEVCLKRNQNADEFIGAFFNDFEVDEEMADAVQLYLDTVREYDGDPEVGDFIGSKADSYLLSVNGSGFLVLAVDKTNAIVYVRG